jgi:photosystem II stability/assembly factor-like uncharacterized protein
VPAALGVLTLACAAAAPAGGAPTLAHLRGAIPAPTYLQVARQQPVAVSFVTTSTGYLATARGALLATGDGGRSWQRVGPELALARLDFLSARRGYALTHDDGLLETLDAGRTWTRIHAFPKPRLDGPYRGTLEFLDAAHGFAGALDGGLYRTADGGRSWAAEKLPCRAVAGLWFTSRGRGYAICGEEAGAGSEAKTLFVTTDGGRRWRVRATTGQGQNGSLCAGGALPCSGYPAGLAFPTASVGYLTADRGGVYRTTDGGRSWKTALFTDDVYDPLDSSWLDASNGYVLLHGAGLVATADGGRTWHLAFPVAPGPPTGPLAFDSPSDGVAAGAAWPVEAQGRIVSTTNGGRTWRLRGRLRGEAVSELAEPAAGTVFALAQPASHATREIRLYRSTDGGRTWRLEHRFAGAVLASLSFPAAAAGYVANRAGLLYRTRDGGRSWSPAGKLPAGVEALGFLTLQIGLAIVEPPFAGPSLLFTRDGGRSWHSLAFGSLRYEAVATLGPRRAWIVASRCSIAGRLCRGAILRTSDGARTWTQIDLRRPLATTGLDFATSGVGYANDGGLLRTRDGGRRWARVTGPAELP